MKIAAGCKFEVKYRLPWPQLAEMRRVVAVEPPVMALWIDVERVFVWGKTILLGETLCDG